MALISWSNAYSVGVREIDEQHKKLVDILNELHEAMKAGHGKDKVEPVLARMADYAVMHFSTEEKYMMKHSYPELTSHRSEHQAFMKKVTQFVEDFRKGKATVTLELSNFLRDWLLKHIQGVDRKYGPWFNERGLS